MPQLLQKYKNTNTKSAAYSKYFVRPVYPDKFVTTKELADFIQTQATVKRSDCKAVLDELGGALQHFLGLGQKVKIDNIGIFKVGISSQGSTTKDLCTASNVKNVRVLFQPETVSEHVDTVVSERTGRMVKVYNRHASMLSEVTFELSPDSVASETTPPTP